jgi:hypothetical protein
MKTGQFARICTQAFDKHDKYNHSAKGRARLKRYDESEKGIARHERFYARHGGKRAYDMGRYYRIQSEAGCHSHIDSFYPAYRFIKSLENAEVIEIYQKGA